ncbi:unnamed protein product [Linum tenue]|uniref:Uncharacterized protein n=1 Tax=Linum tenue TaxID=586396 RepID=A0AAV0P722_9ROSI|nr:unnamed protein product [Linum tenue]
MVMDMAKSNEWGRCPQCKFYVERTEGCPHIICRFLRKKSEFQELELEWFTTNCKLWQ